jgi:hypothetical protein
LDLLSSLDVTHLEPKDKTCSTASEVRRILVIFEGGRVSWLTGVYNLKNGHTFLKQAQKVSERRGRAAGSSIEAIFFKASFKKLRK